MKPLQICFGLCCLLQTTYAQAAPVEIKSASSIDAVTVYLGSASVTRVASVKLPAGDVRLRFEGLTDQLVDDSVRVSGQGSAKGVIRAASVERVEHAQATAAQVAALQGKIDDLEQKKKILEDRVSQADTRKTFLDSMKSTYLSERTQNLAVRAVDPKEWGAIYDFVGREYALVLEQRRKAQMEWDEVALQVNALQRELDALGAKDSRFDKTLLVDLHSDKPGDFNLSFNYLVGAVSWSPLWDARLDADREKLNLSLYASVRQNSGEDWSDVKLTVSTAQPLRSVNLPDLQPHYLDKYQTPIAYERLMKRAMPMMAEQGMAIASAMPMEQVNAEVAQNLLAVTFTTPSRESVDGAGQARKLFLQDFPLSAEIMRSAIPKISPQVFLSAKASNDRGVALLGGPVSLFLNDEFVGKTTLPNTVAGDSLNLAFGVDERVRVTRNMTRFHDTKGVFSAEDRYRYQIRTVAKNHYIKPVKLDIIDQIPVSRDENIKVLLGEASTEPSQPDDAQKPGIRHYTLTLPPAGEQSIDLLYDVRVPKGQQVSGLE